MSRSDYLRWKRLLDIVLAVVLLALTAPLFALIALLIKWDDPQGPVFFRQKRVGRGGNPFWMWKFRTMVRDAEGLRDEVLKKCKERAYSRDGYVKIRWDPRVTSVGRVLRPLSLDELPQLFNVLKGEMSLVGPRPLVWGDADLRDPRIQERCEVLPGLTGLWQISGRNNLVGERALEVDLEYARQRTLGMDLLVLLKTPWAVISCRGAY